MSKKSKVPSALRFVRWLFPKLEKLAPPLATRLFVQLFFTPLRYPIPEKELEWIKNADTSEFILNKKKIKIYSWGEVGKPVVLFVHGWAGRATQFRKFFPILLEAGFRVVAFDGPAHGRSDGRRTNILEFGEALSEVLRMIGKPSCTIAHSFGGVASLYGATKGEPIVKLINIGTPVIADKLIMTFLEAVNGSWSTGLKFKAYIIAKFNRSFEEFSIEYFIQHLQVPVNLFLVHDENDKDVSIDHPEELVRLYPSAKFYKTSGLGHTQILKDDDVIRQCLRFIMADG